eukprot:9247704-Heterocapsa_arctica.AAC.1
MRGAWGIISHPGSVVGAKIPSHINLPKEITCSTGGMHIVGEDEEWMWREGARWQNIIGNAKKVVH